MGFDLRWTAEEMRSICVAICLVVLVGFQAVTAHAFSLSDAPSVKQLTTHGFLVGTMTGGNGEAGEKLAKHFASSDIKFTLQIDDEWYNADLMDGSFMIPLPPGEHELRVFRAFGSAYGYGARLIENFPLRETFRIEVGKITTLGATYLYEKDSLPEDLAKKNATGLYRALHVDNGAFMAQYLQRSHAEIYAAITDKTLHPAQAFLNKEQFGALHTAMARARLRAVFRGDTRYSPNMRYLVYGALGMAGHLFTNAEGVALRFSSFGLDTMETVHRCEADSARYVCLTQDDGRRSRVERRAYAGPHRAGKLLQLPEGSSPIGAHLFGTDGILLGDYQHRLQVRTSSQGAWQTFGGEEVKAGAFVARYAFGDTADGFFTYYEGNRHALTFTATDGSTREVPLPKNFKGGAELVITDRHLLIGPEWNLLADSEMYRLDRQSGEWMVSRLPMARCDWMGLDLKDKKRLLAACGISSDKTFVSFDDGASWFSE